MRKKRSFGDILFQSAATTIVCHPVKSLLEAMVKPETGFLDRLFDPSPSYFIGTFTGFTIAYSGFEIHNRYKMRKEERANKIKVTLTKPSGNNEYS